jgi:hypothetical protein
MNRRTGVVAVLYRLTRYGASERKLSASTAIWTRSGELGQFETRSAYPTQPSRGQYTQGYFQCTTVVRGVVTAGQSSMRNPSACPHAKCGRLICSRRCSQNAVLHRRTGCRKRNGINCCLWSDIGPTACNGSPTEVRHCAKPVQFQTHTQVADKGFKRIGHPQQSTWHAWRHCNRQPAGRCSRLTSWLWAIPASSDDIPGEVASGTPLENKTLRIRRSPFDCRQLFTCHARGQTLELPRRGLSSKCLSMIPVASMSTSFNVFIGKFGVPAREDDPHYLRHLRLAYLVTR